MHKPTFIFINIEGEFESIAQRIKQEGYPVYSYTQKGMSKGREDTGIGILDTKELIDDYWEILNNHNKEDLILLLDDNSEGDMVDHLRAEGYTVIGGSGYVDKLEYERSCGTKLMADIGLGLPQEYIFTNFNEALAFLDKQKPEARFVFKPDGENFAGGARTYTGKNKQDLIDFVKWMQHDSEEKKYSIIKFLFQEFIEGIEADFSAYFDGEKFMEGSIMLTIEEKKSGDGNKGEAVGCMGNVLLFMNKSTYFDTYITKLTPLLKKINYVGEIAINNIFAYGNDKYKAGMPYGLELTPRFGWDAHLTELQLIIDTGGKIADFYIALANKQPFTFPTGKVGCGVRVYTGSISLKKEDVKGRYFSFEKIIEKNLWFYSVSKSKEGYCIEDNPVLVVNASSNTLDDAITKCYTMLDKQLNIPDIYYRKEIGKRAKEVIRFLLKYNWI